MVAVAALVLGMGFAAPSEGIEGEEGLPAAGPFGAAVCEEGRWAASASHLS